jgi:hypothetical protein
MRCGEFDDAVTTREQQRICVNDQSIRRLLGDRSERYREVR